MKFARFLGHLALAALLGLLAAAILFTLVALHVLGASPGEWAYSLRWGPFTHQLSVPALVRVGTHPAVLRLLEGHAVPTPYGPLRWTPSSNGGTIVCTPCQVRATHLGSAAIRIERVAFTLQRQIDGQLHGSFVLGDPARAVKGRWSSHLTTNGAKLHFTLSEVPLADAYALFANVLPEASTARIGGRVSLTAQLHLPSHEWTVQPMLTGFRVEGLGTEALLNAAPSCDPPGESGGLSGVWLPRAVIAAEDQRFYEHTGYDLAEISAAWDGPRVAEHAPRGASTLSQQLAKLIYTGDERSHVRKLRELLYAVELDRTLGKARVLNLYLSLVPWGEGQCGAQAAARHYLGKDARRLVPVEAAWLASLLRNPDGERLAMTRRGQVNLARVDWVMAQMRPLPPRRQRLQAVQWRPPALAFSSLGTSAPVVASKP